MPTYDFKCPKCQITVEITASVEEQCAPTCDCGLTMEKQFSAVPTIFKTKGFYSTGG